jgi:hypothetical protein
MSKGDETLLRRWDGAQAEMFRYGASHQELTIRLFRDGQRGQLWVSCGACLHICGPTEWNDAHIDIAKERDIWMISDKKSDVTIKCRVFGVAEDE